MRRFTTFYDALDVRPAASADEITRAYHRLVRQYHPDLHHGSTAANTALRAINVAAATLRDEAARAVYDATLAASTLVELHDGRAHGYDATYTITISTAEARSGTTGTLHFHGPDGQPRPLTITIPPNCTSGVQFVVRGAGGPSEDGGRHGDLWVQVLVAPVAASNAAFAKLESRHRPLFGVWFRG